MSRRGRTARVASRQRVETLGNGTGAPTNKTIQTAETGELYFIDHNHASALTITLPPMQDGAYFKFVFKTALTADGSVVVATSEATAGSIVGSIFEQVTGGSNAHSGVDTDDGTDIKITLSDDIHPGSWVECFCDGSVWHAHARLNVSGVGESGFGDYVAPNTMTRLAAGFDQGYVSQVPLANIASKTVGGAAAGEGGWEDNGYRVLGASSPNKRILRISYGKDGSGNPHYVVVSDADTDSDFQVSATNFYTEQNWTRVTTTLDPKQHKVLWGNDVWISVGAVPFGGAADVILRSTDGTSWSTIDITTMLSDASMDGQNLQGLTSDGAGTWWMGGATKLFKSTDDGQTWALEKNMSSITGGGGIRHMMYTNNTVVALIKYTVGGANEVRIVSAAASDTTDWGTPVALNDGTGGSGIMHVDQTKRGAAGNGRVIVIDTGNSMAVDVDGKTATRASNRIKITDDDTVGEGNVNDIATDGEGNWYICSDGDDGADLMRSTDNGINWTRIVTDINISGDRDMESLAVDAYLPL
jgi:hypothetical protein